MKAILFLFSLFFSNSVFSASTNISDYLTATGMGYDFIYYGGIGGGAVYCSQDSCVGSQHGADFAFLGWSSTPTDDEEHFFQETDMTDVGMPVYKVIARTFLAGNGFYTTQDFDFTITYDSFGIENVRLLVGEFLDLNSSTSGFFELSAEAGQYLPLGIFGLLSDVTYADDAFLSFELTIKPETISEVPLPASVFFLAPALLGFIGLRRKTISP